MSVELAPIPTPPLAGDVDAYLVKRFLATHRERFLAGREDKRAILLSWVDWLAPTPVVAATAAQAAAWLGDDGPGTLEFATLEGFCSWAVGEGLCSTNVVAQLRPALPAVRVGPPVPKADTRPAWTVEEVDRLYAEILHEIGDLARRGGTAVGAGTVIKRVALAHGVTLAASLPLPRLTRVERHELPWRAEG